ncbi:uncharacterized protein LOC128800969 isoform X6 [Vidua chalybeata]|uniref:uncharacterized protein LOC128800969 isoform X6 n=1 Tax=Vidua chalybeata TaxID=81927 RepID=UPI0023A810B1|nr:uncharacterized protein LOC128800969 isoform X6 [Vidua chalybeata]
MGPEVRTQPLQMTHSLSRAASFSGSRLPWWDEPLCHFSIPLQFSLGWRISQLSLLAPDTAGLRRDVGLDAKGRGVAVLFHSLPVTDFTPTTGTPRATGRAHSWVIQAESSGYSSTFLLLHACSSLPLDGLSYHHGCLGYWRSLARIHLETGSALLQLSPHS